MQVEKLKIEALRPSPRALLLKKNSRIAGRKTNICNLVHQPLGHQGVTSAGAKTHLLSDTRWLKK